MKHILLLFVIFFVFDGYSQTVIPVYTGSIPGAIDCERKEAVTLNNSNNRESVAFVTSPTLTIFIPAKQNAARSAVIICPGGGYSRLAITHEGYDVARALNDSGITAFVLKYRLPNDSCMSDKRIGPLQDLQHAIQLVRKKAQEWNIDSSKVGILGFSAGGHLVATAATLFDKANLPGVSARPAFAIMIYPVISFTSDLAHAGSKEKLLGKNPNPGDVSSFSTEQQVSAVTPPCFLVHAIDDKTVPIGNTLAFFTALQTHKIKSSMIIYQAGGHGFGMTNPMTGEKWLPSVLSWMRLNSW